MYKSQVLRDEFRGIASELKSTPEVILKYPDLHSGCKIDKLAAKLAQEAVFGDTVLRRCTPKG